MAAPHVLILDTNPIDRKLLALMSIKAGLIPHASGECQDATVALESPQTYAAVFIDLDLPHGGPGLQCLRDIRRIRERQRAHIPIIAVTAYAMESEKQDCFKAGVDAYLSKPFSFSQFAELVHNWIDYNRKPAKAS